MTSISAKTIETLQDITAKACASDAGIPGATVVVVGRDGKELFATAAGKRGAASKEPMTLDSIYWIASCTKMVAGIACMQLVEQGKLSLDDVKQIEELCPELNEVKVLKDDGTLEEKKKGITLRMLLSHTGIVLQGPGNLNTNEVPSRIWIYLLQQEAERLYPARW